MPFEELTIGTLFRNPEGMTMFKTGDEACVRSNGDSYHSYPDVECESLVAVPVAEYERLIALLKECYGYARAGEGTPSDFYPRYEAAIAKAREETQR